MPERCGRAKSRWRAFSELEVALGALEDLAFAAPFAELSPAVAGVFGAESLLGACLRPRDERLD